MAYGRWECAQHTTLTTLALCDTAPYAMNIRNGFLTFFFKRGNARAKQSNLIKEVCNLFTLSWGLLNTVMSPPAHPKKKRNRK